MQELQEQVAEAEEAAGRLQMQLADAHKRQALAEKEVAALTGEAASDPSE